jgi:hypothetical protein
MKKCHFGSVTERVQFEETLHGSDDFKHLPHNIQEKH